MRLLILKVNKLINTNKRITDHYFKIEFKDHNHNNKTADKYNHLYKEHLAD
jgi:hypothetical protein